VITWHTQIAYGSSASNLDDRRLGVQKDEVLALLDDLTIGDGKELAPVHRMWVGYEYALCIYGMFHCMEWTINRGFTDKVFWTLGRAVQELGGSYEAPPWLKDKDVIRSHRSNLMRRWPRHYNWPGTPENLPYIWPIVDYDGGYQLMVAKEDRELLAVGERTIPKRMRERIANL